VEVSDPAERPPSRSKQTFYTVVTVLVWLVLFIGVGNMVAGVVRLIRGDDLALSFLVWGFLFAAAAGWALVRGVDRRPPPEPDPSLGYFAWLRQWVLVHPIRTVICVYFLALLGVMVVRGLGALF
jgi:hypothetical protein